MTVTCGLGRVDVRADRFGIVTVVQRGRVGITLYGCGVYNLVEFVGSDARFNVRSDEVENFSAELESERMSAQKAKRAPRRPALQTVRIFSCSSKVNMVGGAPAALASAIGLPGRKKQSV